MPNLVFGMEPPNGKSAVSNTNDRAHSFRLLAEFRRAEDAPDNVSCLMLSERQNHERLPRMA